MSNLHDHEAEQAQNTAACEAGVCDHPSCGMDVGDIAQQIMDEVHSDDNNRRAARALLCYLPTYEEDPKTSLSDFLTDLLHLCDLAGWDFARIERDARSNYMQERADMGIADHAQLRRAIEAE